MRKNINALIIPFYLEKDEIKFCVLHREDKNVWQFVAGGVEEGETSKVGALRELEEETNIKEFSLFIKLDTVCSVPGYFFSKYFRTLWCEDIFVVTCEAFAVQTLDKNILLSEEHTGYEWLNYEDASKILKFDFDRTALWELNERIKLNNITILK